MQLCVQALILEDNGYVVEEGFLWFAESRERVPVPFDDDLRATTLKAAAELRLTAAARLRRWRTAPSRSAGAACSAP